LLDVFLKIGYKFEAFSKCFPLTAGFKIKGGDPAMAGLPTGIH
jgi:hypothetical protein